MVGALPEGDLAELKELLRTSGVAVVGELIQKRDQPHPNLYLGPGKVDELKALVKAADANLVADRRRADARARSATSRRSSASRCSTAPP